MPSKGRERASGARARASSWNQAREGEESASAPETREVCTVGFTVSTGEPRGARGGGGCCGGGWGARGGGVWGGGGGSGGDSEGEGVGSGRN